jgi:large subunit ribosomal protein L21e
MVKGKRIREKGKLKLSSYFKKIEDGSRVAISIDHSVNNSLNRRVQGRSGVVIGSRGNSKLIKIKDGNKEKVLIVHPIHIRKL